MIQEAEYDMTQGAFLHESQGFNARYAGDDKLFVQFHVVPVLNPAASDEQGRPVFRDCEQVRIMQPGNKDSIVDRPVTDEDKRRFARQYAAWQQGEKELVEGTMLVAVAKDPLLMISLSQIEELKHFGVRTVEQLASISDANAQKFMGINELKKRARVYLEASKERSAQTRLQGELEKRDAQIASQSQAIEELKAMVADLQQMKDKRTRRRDAA